MVDEPDRTHTPDAAGQTALPSETEAVEAEAVTTVVVRRGTGLAVPRWRDRAVALRSALPQLARHPVVVGASAAAATIAVRVAVDVARQALGAQAARSTTLNVTGSVLHEVHVVRHVHVYHHHPVPLSWWPPPPPR